ncbi:FixH family protein [Nocardia arthritidis]|nr:FixH family protein [Nocardia arthritidis]
MTIRQPPVRRRSAVLVVVAALILAVAALVWSLWPSSGGPTVLTSASAQHTVVLTAADLRVGTTAFDLEISDAHGAPATLDQVRVEPVMAMMGHAIGAVTAKPVGPGRFRADGIELTMAGQWQITVTLVDRSGIDRVIVPVTVGN